MALASLIAPKIEKEQLMEECEELVIDYTPNEKIVADQASFRDRGCTSNTI